MAKFVTTVIVEAETKEQAEKVMDERIYYDEELGFDYSVDYGPISELNI